MCDCAVGCADAASNAQGMSLDDSELREYGHGMLGNVVQELGANFAPYLQPCVEAAIASCSQVGNPLPIAGHLQRHLFVFLLALHHRRLSYQNVLLTQTSVFSCLSLNMQYTRMPEVFSSVQ